MKKYLTKSIRLILFTIYAFAFVYTDNKNVFYIPLGPLLMVLYLIYQLDFRKKPKFNRKSDLEAGGQLIFLAIFGWLIFWVNNVGNQIFVLLHNTFLILMYFGIIASMFFPMKGEEENIKD